MRRLDRNRLVAPMSGFGRIPNPSGAEELGVVASFENNKYGVFLKTTKSAGFAMLGPDGKPQDMDIVHLIVVRLDKKNIEIPWAEKQAIKNELLGPMTEAVELLPAEMRRMSSIPDYQTHIWALTPGAQMPLGLIPRAMQELMREDSLKDVMVNKEELELYTVEDGGVLQIYGSHAEAAAGYGEKEMPEGVVGRIGDVPTESESVVWSDAAKSKVAAVLDKAERLNVLMNNKTDQPTESRISTNGPHTDQDDLEDDYEIDHASPNGDEENVMMPEFMAMGVEKMRQERMDSIGDAVTMLEAKMEKDQVSEEEEEKSEQEARDELSAMREQMRADRAKDSNS